MTRAPSVRPLHRRSLFAASMGPDRGKHYCMECTTYCDDGARYVLWPCATARYVANGWPVAEPLDARLLDARLLEAGTVP